MLNPARRAALARLIAFACLIASAFVFANGAHARGVYPSQPYEAPFARARHADHTLPNTDDGGRLVRTIGNVGSSVVAVASHFLGSGNPTGFHEAWCRDFVNLVLERSGHHLRDRSHIAISALNLGPRVRQPVAGDLAVMRNHVTIFVKYDGRGSFIGIGGNQGHRVKYSRFALGSVVGFVRPA